MKKRKFTELSEPQKRFYMYLGLLIASLFFAIGNPQGSWLPIGLGIGMIVVYAPDALRRLKNGRKEHGDGEPEDQNDQDR
ncbi:hypothetical protein [Caproiciproducens faecalis]|uniref:Uncharacterized protein n=1 Tax=Caproiciproducens faecalis TaxID=2820301 RepID=A0ABS7DQS2_9FIRM|nr:hypothetical protein [Caproiciproducens faecalis]MBW7572926.1 hypothetical protein [Caproiciproducens faecalis]